MIDTTLGNPNDTTAAALSLTPDPNDPSKDVEPWPFLFGFSGGHVNVSAMSFNISTFSPAVSWMLEGGPVTGLGAAVLVTGSAGSTFDRVGFAVGAGDWGGYNVGNDIVITGRQQVDSNGYPTALAPTGGCDSVARCSLAGYPGIWVDGLTAGRLTVGGARERQNVFDRTSPAATSATTATRRSRSLTTGCRAAPARASGASRVGPATSRVRRTAPSSRRRRCRRRAT